VKGVEIDGVHVSFNGNSASGSGRVVRAVQDNGVWFMVAALELMHFRGFVLCRNVVIRF
jgi:hypothetical protein